MTTFVHLDGVTETVEDPITVESLQGSNNINSTLVEPGDYTNDSKNSPRLTKSLPGNFAPRKISMSVNSDGHSEDHNGVGNMSHIPRTPPSPSTYTIPSIMNRSIGTEYFPENDLFGMIKLRENDVCYTSGQIEWVGRKRSFPINSGFKIISESYLHSREPQLKKVKRLNKTSTSKTKDCDCTDVLPTVNAIVDHLNALHEAVDLVDLRLNTLEGVVDKIGE